MRNLQAAWLAIEKGDHLDAQSIVAQILREDPRNAEAWMVLGEAVAGDRRELFLRKALQLDPNLTIARDRLAELEALKANGSLDEPQDAEEAIEVPDGVSLDAPTVPIEERLKNATRSTPIAPKNQTSLRSSKRETSNLQNTIALVLIFLAILVVIYFLIQSLPV